MAEILSYIDSGQDVSFEAGAAMDAYTVVYLDSDGKVQKYVGGTSDKQHAFVLQEPATLGRQVRVRINGVTPVRVGGAVSAGYPAGIDATGKVINGTSGDFVLGTFLAPATGGDELAPVVMHSIAWEV